MVNFEKMGTQPQEANAQLHDFEIAATQEELDKEYENLFEGVESADMDALCEEFGDILDEAPEEVIEEIEKGNLNVFIEKVMDGVRCSRKKAQQIAIFALVSMMASPAFAEKSSLDYIGDAVKQSQEMQHAMQGGEYKRPKQVTIKNGVQVTPLLHHQSGAKHGQYVNGVTVNGQPAQVIYQPNGTTVIGVPGVSGRTGNADKSVGCITVK